MVLFTVVSQDNCINSKQTKFNWPANYKTYRYYMPLFKNRFLGKNVPYFPCIYIPHCVIQWQGTVVQSLTFCIHSDQTKWRHFYFLRPKIVKATNIVHNLSITRLVQWYAACSNSMTSSYCIHVIFAKVYRIGSVFVTRLSCP